MRGIEIQAQVRLCHHHNVISLTILILSQNAGAECRMQSAETRRDKRVLGSLALLGAAEQQQPMQSKHLHQNDGILCTIKHSNNPFKPQYQKHM